MSTPSSGPRRRPTKNTFTTRSGTTFKVNRSMSDRIRARRDAKARRRAAYLSALPKTRFKRMLYRLHPRQLARYWFSRDGAIMALKICGIGIVVCFILVVGVFAYFRKDLPNIKDISGNKLGGSITYYDRTGQTVLWQDYDAVKRIPVTSDSISPYMKNATVAIEDKDFYKHGAFDVRGIVRAATHDLFGGGGAVQGGSTITQQVVKLNENWTDNRTITRKVKELILATELEKEYSKNDILTAYLNIAPYGGIEYGAEIGARDYFGTSAKDLTLPQAAMLAAIPQSPDIYSPNSPDFDKQALLNRQHYILNQMADQHMITKQQAQDAINVDILSQVKPLQPKYDGIKAPYFVLSAKQQLENKYGTDTINRGGWKVTTTVNLDLQNVVEKLVANNLPNVKRYGGDDEAMVAEDVKSGQVVAEVGGVDFSNADYGQINFASAQRVPPGSSFKPYDYASLVEYKGAGAGSVLYDTQSPLPGYPCTDKNRPTHDNNANCLWDYDFNYPGPLTIRYALAGSRNVPAVKAMLSVGTDKVISTADALMGNTDGYACYQQGTDVSQATKQDEAPCYGASAIGDGAFLHLNDHVNGLSSLARLGNYIPQTYILKITDSSNHTVDQWTQPKPKQVIRPDSAYIIDNILSDPNASYLPTSYKFQHYKGWDFAVKTGTTNDNFDGLMTSWSTQYAVVAWVGYHTRNKAMTAGGMEYMTTPLVRGFMEQAHDMLNTKPVNWTAPTDIKTLPAYVVRGGWGSGAILPSPSTDIFPAWYTAKSGSNLAQTIDVVSNKLATSCTPDLAKKTVGGGNDNAFSVDPYVNGGSTGSTTITANDDVHDCSDAKPTITVTVPDGCTVGASCTITVAVAQGTHAISSDQYPGVVNLLVNGQKVSAQNVSTSPANLTFQYTPTTAGQTTITGQVIDSVLYESSYDATATIGAGSSTTPTP
ncbi:MAG TPA: transglycosylase domain-containing protein [Candidatus Saccharimonadales bacterium]|nr:transglycosylase domain-containing protein [Candidatus Saccharimonadales bacterium]